MLQRLGFLLVIALTLTLSGCFRQASEDFEAVGDQDAQEVIISPDAPPTATDDGSGVTFMTSTPILPPTETPIEPELTEDTTGVEPTSTEDNSFIAPPTNTEDNSFIQPPTNTVEPTVDTSVQQVDPTNTEVPTQADVDGNPTEQTVTEAPTFITPVAPNPGLPDTLTPPPTNTSLPGVDSELPATPTGIFIPTDECVYTVQAGDNLYRIAVNNNTTLDELRLANPDIVGDLIQPGDQLILPAEGCVEGGVDAGIDIDPDATTSELPEGIQAIHVVQAGETLNIIARRYGVTISEVAQANGITNINRISLNQELLIPFPAEDDE